MELFPLAFVCAPISLWIGHLILKRMYLRLSGRGFAAFLVACCLLLNALILGLVPSGREAFHAWVSMLLPFAPAFLFAFAIIFGLRKSFHCPQNDPLAFVLLLEAGILVSGALAVPLGFLRGLLLG